MRKKHKENLKRENKEKNRTKCWKTVTKKENALNKGERDREEWRNEHRVPENVPNFCGKAFPPSLKKCFLYRLHICCCLKTTRLEKSG